MINQILSFPQTLTESLKVLDELAKDSSSRMKKDLAVEMSLVKGLPSRRPGLALFVGAAVVGLAAGFWMRRK